MVLLALGGASLHAFRAGAPLAGGRRCYHDAEVGQWFAAELACLKYVGRTLKLTLYHLDSNAWRALEALGVADELRASHMAVEWCAAALPPTLRHRYLGSRQKTSTQLKQHLCVVLFCCWRQYIPMFSVHVKRAKTVGEPLCFWCRMEAYKSNGKRLNGVEVAKCAHGPHEWRGLVRNDLQAALAAALPEDVIRTSSGVASVSHFEEGASSQIATFSSPPRGIYLFCVWCKCVVLHFDKCALW